MGWTTHQQERHRNTRKTSPTPLNVVTHRTFFHRWSWVRIANPASGLKLTGWATVEVQVKVSQTNGLDIIKTQSIQR